MIRNTLHFRRKTSQISHHTSLHYEAERLMMCLQRFNWLLNQQSTGRLFKLTILPKKLQAEVGLALFPVKDDVVIQVIGDFSECRVEMRSRSRYGLGEMGKNAKRIRKFFSDLDLVLHRQ
eukprot:TRINITY_DN11038_c0_g1_i1.p1 TRINITY_DN11038_c0_g1~~TRINITY_DN11038_c0_g1_i1.p1  ORF type:complete len:120 (-),score=15.15 TRINITY_DN11038_c0_g1_i1:88-447(-)